MKALIMLQWIKGIGVGLERECLENLILVEKILALLVHKNDWLLG